MKSCAAVAAVALECARPLPVTDRSQDIFEQGLASSFVELFMWFEPASRLCDWCREGELNPQGPKPGGF